MPPFKNSLESPDYDPVSQLDKLFPSPDYLDYVEKTAEALEHYQNAFEEEISRRITQQLQLESQSQTEIKSNIAVLDRLFSRIEDIHDQAFQTEQSIVAMTAEIKRIDRTKRNLTLSMTVVKRLQMLTIAYEKLRFLTKSRQYMESASLLQAVLQLSAHFKSYRSINQIAILTRNVSELQKELLENILEDFEIAFVKDQVAWKKTLLSEACQVVEVLGDVAKSQIINSYCSIQLREYWQIFRGSDEAGSLDNIPRRFSWFHRVLNQYDNEHAEIFPVHWKVGECLTEAFCHGTRDDFKILLERLTRPSEGREFDFNSLLTYLHETLDFEHSLELRFSSNARSAESMTFNNERSFPFIKTISQSFEPYMSLWIESQEKQLASLLQVYKKQPLRNKDEDLSDQLVIPSSTELFNFYRNSLAQCARLSTGALLLDLSKVFAQFLEKYAQQTLTHFLLEQSSSNETGVEDVILILKTADYCYRTTNQLEEKIKAQIEDDQREKVDLQNSADAFMGVASAGIRVLVQKVMSACEPAWKEMRHMPWELIRLLHTSSGRIHKHLQNTHYSRAFCDHLLEKIINSLLYNIVQCKPISETGAEQLLVDSYGLKKTILEIAAPLNNNSAKASESFIKRVNLATSKVDGLLKTIQVGSNPPEGLVQAYLIHIGDRSESNFKKVLEIKGIRRQELSNLLSWFSVHSSSPAHANLAMSNPFMNNLTAGTGSVIGPANVHKDPILMTSTPSLSGGLFDAAMFGSAIINAAKEGVDRFGGSHNLGGMNHTNQGSNNSSKLPLGAPNSHSSPRLRPLQADHAPDHGSASGSPSSLVPPSSPKAVNDSIHPNAESPSSTSLAAGNASSLNTSQASANKLNDNFRNFGRFFRRDLGVMRFSRAGAAAPAPEVEKQSFGN